MEYNAQMRQNTAKRIRSRGWHETMKQIAIKLRKQKQEVSRGTNNNIS